MQRAVTEPLVVLAPLERVLDEVVVLRGQRFQAPRLEAAGDVGGSKLAAALAGRASLELVGREVLHVGAQLGFADGPDRGRDQQAESRPYESPRDASLPRHAGFQRMSPSHSHLQILAPRGSGFTSRDLLDDAALQRTPAPVLA